MTDSERFFIAQCIRHARRDLPLRKAVKFLRGMTMCCGEVDAAAKVRRAFENLSDADAQLELIASGQLRLDLTRDSAK